MIFIFDWGFRTFTSYGYLTTAESAAATAEVSQLYRIRYWFRAFFIPLIPTRTEYVVGDRNSYNRISRQEFDRLLPFARLNKRVANGEVSEEEYNRLYDELCKNF